MQPWETAAASLWSRNNRPSRWGRIFREEKKSKNEPRKEVDDDGYKGGCPCSFSSVDPSGDCELSAAKASAEEAGLNLTRYDFYRMILFLASPTIFLRFFSLPRAFILTALPLSYDKPYISGDKRFSKRLLILSHLEYYFFFLRIEITMYFHGKFLSIQDWIIGLR